MVWKSQTKDPLLFYILMRKTSISLIATEIEAPAVYSLYALGHPLDALFSLYTILCFYLSKRKFPIQFLYIICKESGLGMAPHCTVILQ